jgi:hypothetical protein
MMIVEFVVKGILYILLVLGTAITVVTAALALSAFIPATLLSAIQSRFTLHPRKT